MLDESPSPRTSFETDVLLIDRRRASLESSTWKDALRHKRTWVTVAAIATVIAALIIAMVFGVSILTRSSSSAKKYFLFYL
jgi:hypothetical protein